MPSLMAVFGADGRGFRNEIGKMDQISTQFSKNTIAQFDRMAAAIELQMATVDKATSQWENYAASLRAVQAQLAKTQTEMAMGGRVSAPSTVHAPNKKVGANEAYVDDFGRLLNEKDAAKRDADVEAAARSNAARRLQRQRGEQATASSVEQAARSNRARQLLRERAGSRAEALERAREIAREESVETASRSNAARRLQRQRGEEATASDVEQATRNNRARRLLRERAAKREGGRAHGQTGLSGILGEAFVIMREIGRGNFSRIPGSLSILGQRLGWLKFLFTALGASAAAALAGIAAGIAIAYNRVTGLANRLAGFQLPDFKVDHVAKYLQKVNLAGEAWKNIGMEVRRVNEAYDSVNQSAERHLEILKEQFAHAEELNAIAKQTELDQGHGRTRTLEIEAKYARISLENKKRERAAELEVLQQQERDLAKEGRTKMEQAAKLIGNPNFIPEAKEEQKTEMFRKNKEAAEEYLKERREAEQNVKGGLTEGMNLKRTAARKFYSSMGISGQTDSEIDAADFESKRRASKQINTYNAWIDGKAERDRARTRVSDLEGVGKDSIAKSAELARSNKHLATVNSIADKNDEEKQIARLTEMARKPLARPNIEINDLQKHGGFIGGPNVQLVDINRSMDRTLKAILVKFNSPNGNGGTSGTRGGKF
jgi:hypothetical protein